MFRGVATALRHACRVAVVSLLGAGIVLGCAGMAPLGRPFTYFQSPAPDDPWAAKIQSWQERERAAPVADAFAATPSTVAAGPGVTTRSSDELLRTKYLRFRAEHKRAFAREVAAWVQEQSRHYYIPDGVIDHWATLEETLSHNGDDCDGLELLAYYLLLDSGFRRDEVYRAIVYRPEDGQHHMVTMWFENGSDPWVIDPTGAMTTGMPRMSEVKGWIPLRIFSETQEFAVHASAAARASAASAPPPPPSR
jgi:hypothetical protein